MQDFNDFMKYRWFYTLSGKLIVAGKSAEQNDELLSRMKKMKEDFIVMHTSSPGSPFSVIISKKSDVNKSDIEQCAIFTACFSKLWKSSNKKASVDIFSLSQLNKSREMKQGTWGVIGKVNKISVSLSLVLVKQNGILRAVPEKSAKNKKDILLRVIPGNLLKQEIASKLIEELGSEFSESDILAALPSGGIKVTK